MRMFLMALAMPVLLAVGACGGGGGDPPATTPRPSVGGLWAVNTTQVQGRVLVTEDGRFFGSSVNLANNCVVLNYGSVVTNGNAFTGTATGAIATVSVGAPIADCTFPDGTLSATTSLSGSFVPQTSITVTSTATSSLGLSLGTQTSSLQFDPLYNVPSSLTAIAGTWNGPTGNTLTIGSTGAFSAIDATTGCVLSGQVSIIDTRYNAYAASGGYSSCGAAASSLNGGTVRALMLIDSTSVPTRLVIGQETTLVSGTRVVVLSTGTR
jgi:hypothetical protein